MQSDRTISTWEDEQLFNLVNTGTPDGFNRAQTFNPNTRVPMRTAVKFEERDEERQYLEQTVWQPSYNFLAKNQELEVCWASIAYNLLLVGGAMVAVGVVANYLP